MRKTKTGERGQAMVEVTLLAPWIFFLFIGIFDFGFYSYEAITTEGAARVAANQIAKSPGFSSAACPIVVPEMSLLVNVAGAAASCTEGSTTVSAATPVAVCVGILNSTASTPCGFQRATPPPDPCIQKCADCCLGLTTTPTSVVVGVTYQSPFMVNIPGILTNQLILRRFAEMRILQ
jgi:Flp pilus assembly protein TadG